MPTGHISQESAKQEMAGNPRLIASHLLRDPHLGPAARHEQAGNLLVAPGFAGD
jgi:hypothetical protein